MQETISKNGNTVILFAAVRLYQGNRIPSMVKSKDLLPMQNTKILKQANGGASQIL